MFALQVTGMSCGGCVRRVTAAVQSVDQSAKVEVDLQEKNVRVKTVADAQAVARAVTAAGYPASLAETTWKTKRHHPRVTRAGKKER